MKGVHTRKGSKKKYWRRSVPSALWQRRDELVALGISVQGTVSTSFSLGTEDQNEAERRALDLEASWRDELSRWERALQHKPAPLTIPERDGLLRIASALIDKRYPVGSEPKRVRLKQRYTPEIRQAFLDFTDHHPDFPIPSDPKELVRGADGELYSQGVRAPEGFSQLMRAMHADTLKLHAEAVAEPLLREALEQSGIPTLHPDDRLPLLLDIAKQVNRYRIANHKAAETRDYRTRKEVVDHWEALPDLPKKRKSGNAGQGETLWDCFERWEIVHLAREKSAKTVGMYRDILERLETYLGTAALGNISQADLQRWRLNLLRPEDGSAALSPKTVDGKYINAIKAVLKHRDTDLFPHSPAAEMSTRTEERTRNRESAFTEDEAVKILSASRTEDRALWGRTGQDTRFACRWAPWVMAFSGARVVEVIQLRKQDVMREGDVDYLLITPEAGHVKTRKFRKVPLHPQLLKMGILEEFRARPGDRVFVPPSALDPEKRAESLASSVGKFVRGRVGISDGGVAPNHGWRYWFYNQCDKAPEPMDDKHAFAITGHSRVGGSGYNYRQLPSVVRLAEKLRDLPWVELPGVPMRLSNGADDAPK